MKTWEDLTDDNRKALADLAVNFAALQGGLIMDQEQAGRDLFEFFRDYTHVFEPEAAAGIRDLIGLADLEPDP
jgi:hypothetical protein